MNELPVNSILRVKLDNEWIEVPALRGNSVYTLPAVPTQREIASSGSNIIVQTGYILKVVDERKKATDPSYQYDEYTIWNGLDGSGSVNSVDSVLVTDGTTNVALKAVRYGAEQALSTAEQVQARANINAQVSGNYIASPSDKMTNQFLQYLGNDNWTTSTVQVLPSSEQIGILRKASSSLDDLEWVPALTSSDIDIILEE